MRKIVSATGIALFLRGAASALVVVEEVIDALCQFFVDAVHCFQLRQRRARDAAGRAEAIQQSSVQPSFGDLARQHSEDAATRYHGGDGGWMTRGQKSHAWPQEVMTAVFALKAPGEISPVIPAPEGLYLVKLMERTEAAAAPLEQVRERIAWRLHQDRVQRGQKEFYERQKAGLRVTVHRDLLETIKLPSPPAATTPEAPPPALPRP